MTERFAIAFISEAALKEYRSFRGDVKTLIDKGISRLRQRADVIGKPLTGALKGCRELKFRADGIRIIYRIVDGEVEIVEIVAIGKRERGAVFRDAENRLVRHLWKSCRTGCCEGLSRAPFGGHFAFAAM